MIIKLRENWQSMQGQSLKCLAARYSISVPSAKKYIAMTDEEVEQIAERRKNRKRKDTVTGAYLNIIYKMLRDGYTAAFVFSYVLHLGYSGNPETMARMIGHIAYNNFNIQLGAGFQYAEAYPPDVSVIRRRDILKYITVADKDTMKGTDVAKYFPALKEHYSAIQQTEDMYQKFHSILMGNEPEKLDGFIAQFENMAHISGFVDGLKKDIAPVKNAISLSVSSGFVEGNNNKFKLIKRILFGRSGLANLFRKCYATFSITRPKVSVQSMIPGLNMI